MHAPDLKYRFARVLGARRPEIEAILAEDGIPGYRIREALHDLEEVEEEESGPSATKEPEDSSVSLRSTSDNELSGSEDEQYEDASLDQDEEAEESRGSNSSEAPSSRRTEAESSVHRSDGSRAERRLVRRKLFGSGRDQDNDRSQIRHKAAEVASAAAVRGMRAEAWLMQQIVSLLGPDWTCLANMRDDQLRETDMLLSRNGEEWHIEVKCLSAERLYWSELEREKAELHPDRYLMALLVEAENSAFTVYWSWDPLRDLAPLGRRIEWLWENSSEGPSLKEGWKLEPDIRWPERRADRYIHVVRLRQEDLERLDKDGSDLQLLRTRIGDGLSVQTHSGGGSKFVA
ncbi:hypothetical protein FHG71_19310 [Rubellimicrobium roseum]|uniref:Uncharacterized protein n=2 Tax=Rubellimicrobium roseum TaxID=687525 RepID=A0A5C4NBU1_9RHOB|nr:hypothetical protein FHG71_19310 [Rubellimicrobium roseum]